MPDDLYHEVASSLLVTHALLSLAAKRPPFALVIPDPANTSPGTNRDAECLKVSLTYYGVVLVILLSCCLVVLLKSRWSQIRSAAVSLFRKRWFSSIAVIPSMALLPLPEEKPSDSHRSSRPK